MKPEKIKIITPEPYYNIIFRCSNRNFYNVKNELWKLWEESRIEDDFNNGYYSEYCDYEGDLEKIVIYSRDDIKDFIDLVLEYYDCKEELPEGMNLVLSIF